MAKNSADVILRDRMQFTFDADGDRETLYGRIDLSDYVNTVERKGLSVKEVRFQMRDPSNADVDTGVFNPILCKTNPSAINPITASLKLYATTRAYEKALDVGIASPDVLVVQEQIQTIAPYAYDQAAGQDTVPTFNFMWNTYGTPDLHPEGFTVVSDLLIGVAADKCTNYADTTVELDVMLIAQPVSVTTARMNEILTQAQDL